MKEKDTDLDQRMRHEEAVGNNTPPQRVGLAPKVTSTASPIAPRTIALRQKNSPKTNTLRYSNDNFTN